MVDEGFFLLKGDAGLGDKIIMYSVYLLTLLATIIILAVRYIIVAFGVVFFPIGIFLYFIEPAKKYGKLIMNFLLVSISLTFFDAVILLVSSQLVGTEFFSNFKMMLMIAAFNMCNAMMLYLMFFAAVMSALKTTAKVVALRSNPAIAVASGLMAGKGKNNGGQTTLDRYT